MKAFLDLFKELTYCCKERGSHRFALPLALSFTLGSRLAFPDGVSNRAADATTGASGEAALAAARREAELALREDPAGEEPREPPSLGEPLSAGEEAEAAINVPVLPRSIAAMLIAGPGGPPAVPSVPRTAPHL